MVGGDFTALDISRMYNEDLLEELQELADAQELIVGFDGDDIDFLINLDNTQNEDDDDNIKPLSTKEIDTDDYEFQYKCPRCQFEFNS